MTPEDRAVAERVHVTVTAHAPDLAPKTWYGMPAYANADGKVVLSLKNSGKFGQRYSTLEFQDSARLDDGDIWPVGFAITSGPPRWRRRSPNWSEHPSLDGRRRSSGGAPLRMSPLSTSLDAAAERHRPAGRHRVGRRGGDPSTSLARFKTGTHAGP